MSNCKILHIGWWTSEYRGGGAIIHVETLMEYLKEEGFHNFYFCGGRYNLFWPKPYIKRWSKEYVEIYELVNSPNLIWSFGNPGIHISNTKIESLFLTIIEEIKPDIIHFHELESLTGSLLSIARGLKIPYLVDIHNYWYLCPQRDLIDTNKKVCTDWNEGIKCTTCKVLPSSSRVGWMFVGYVRDTFLGGLLDKLVRTYYTRRIKQEAYRVMVTSEKDAELYKRRREFFISELNAAGALIFPSKRTCEIYSFYGIRNPDSYVLLPLNKNFNIIKPKKIGEIRKQDVLRFGYIGSVIPNKGVHIIINAFEQLEAKYLSRCHLYIYGHGDPAYIEHLKKSGLQNIFFYGSYLPDEINNVLENIDVAIIPSLWEDCSPVVLTELQLSKTPILGSRIGGIEERIKHGINGYLFEPGNSRELSHYLRLLVDSPHLVTNMMRAIDFTFDKVDYMKKIKEIYEKVIRNSKNQ